MENTPETGQAGADFAKVAESEIDEEMIRAGVWELSQTRGDLDEEIVREIYVAMRAVRLEKGQGPQ